MCEEPALEDGVLDCGVGCYADGVCLLLLVGALTDGERPLTNSTASPGMLRSISFIVFSISEQRIGLLVKVTSSVIRKRMLSTCSRVSSERLLSR